MFQLGVYEGAGSDGVKATKAFNIWLGAKVQRALEFLAFDSWTSMKNGAQWAIPSWQGTPLTLSVPLTCQGTSLADVAAGNFDSYFQAVAALLVANGNATAIVRLGWEANGNWYPWQAAPNPAAYIAAFQHVVSVMRAVAGANFLFDWCVAQGGQQVTPDKIYPGDAYVDIVGMDIYAQTWAGAVNWAQVKADFQHNWTLDWLPWFGNLHGKQISIPEFGTGERPDGHGLGDSPQFLAYIYKWMIKNNVLYANYWDFNAGDYKSKISDGTHPNVGALFKMLFGAETAV